MSGSKPKPRHKVLWFVIGGLGLVVLGIVVGFVVLLSGAMSTAATTQHFRITHEILNTGLQFSVRNHADDVPVPALDRPGMIEQGAVCFDTHCVQCHGAPGVAPHAEGRGLLPMPSNLAQSGREWPAAHLYYVTRKGVRMAGMPAWEFRIAEEGLWSTVAFLQRLPFLDNEQYRALIAQAGSKVCPPNESAAPYSDDYAKNVFRQYACDSCHRIDGVVGADSHSGPPLTDWGRRKYIAGVLPNTRENLVRWIVDPRDVSPQTLMPDLEVSEAHARVMSAYLLGMEK